MNYIERIKENVTQELVLGIVCLVVGAANTSVQLKTGNDPTIGIMLLALSVFWLKGGITGHGSL